MAKSILERAKEEKALRALDVRVALEIFGYQWRVHSDGGRQIYPPDFTTEAPPLATGEEPERRAALRYVPGYRSNLHDAGRIAQHYQAQGRKVLLNYDEDGSCRAHIWRVPYYAHRRPHRGEAPTMAHALVLAALAAAEEDNKPCSP